MPIINYAQHRSTKHSDLRNGEEQLLRCWHRHLKISALAGVLGISWATHLGSVGEVLSHGRQGPRLEKPPDVGAEDGG